MKHLALLIFIVLIGCSKHENLCGSTAQKATIKDFTGLDGCGYLIVLDNGERLEPLNLGSQTLKPADGMKVWITYTNAQNAASICMAGQMVNITCISER